MKGVTNEGLEKILRLDYLNSVLTVEEKKALSQAIQSLKALDSAEGELKGISFWEGVDNLTDYGRGANEMYNKAQPLLAKKILECEKLRNIAKSASAISEKQLYMLGEKKESISKLVNIIIKLQLRVEEKDKRIEKYKCNTGWAESIRLEKYIQTLGEERRRDALDGQGALDECNNTILKLTSELQSLKDKLTVSEVIIILCKIIPHFKYFSGEEQQYEAQALIKELEVKV